MLPPLFLSFVFFTAEAAALGNTVLVWDNSVKVHVQSDVKEDCEAVGNPGICYVDWD